MKNQSSGIFGALGFMMLVLASIASFYIWQHRNDAPDVPAPICVSMGDINAYAGGSQPVKANIVLEVRDKDTQAMVNEQLAHAKALTIKSFSNFPSGRIITLEGKLGLQQQILKNLNTLFGPQSIHEVLFTDLVMSIS